MKAKLINTPDLGYSDHVKLLRFLPPGEDRILWKHRLKVAAVRTAQKQWELTRLASPYSRPRPKREVQRELRLLFEELEALYKTVVSTCKGGR